MKEDKIHEIEIELDIASADSASANSLIDVLKKYRKKLLNILILELLICILQEDPDLLQDLDK